MSAESDAIHRALDLVEAQIGGNVDPVLRGYDGGADEEALVALKTLSRLAATLLECVVRPSRGDVSAVDALGWVRDALPPRPLRVVPDAR